MGNGKKPKGAKILEWCEKHLQKILEWCNFAAYKILEWCNHEKKDVSNPVEMETGRARQKSLND